ncbi:tetratricopeptide repeat protein [Aeoliella mucimassa]|uniref:Tetratricopeptide repeat protein n=1 Tax=Aeoliella mucimassa TaxID=2527972 RepID=A0A518ASD7_9BACT|nr:tetratricopeptide repeat protein [Aeoliella mucimassa]QDU57644.1 Tetratricopeptide repeat protein [Aeoliella mucimassa]
MSCEKSPNESVARRAVELHQRGFTKAAIDILEVELQDHPNRGNLWQLRAELLHHQGRFDLALENLEHALLLVPLQTKGHLLLADCHRRLGHDELATHIYLELAEHTGLEDNDLWQLLRGLAATGNWRQAAEVCRREVQQKPDDDRLLFCLAQSLVRLRQPAERVVPLLRRAIHLAPCNCRYRVVLVLQLLKHHRDQEAYDELRQITATDVDSICCRGCLHRLLQLALSQGDADRAEALARHLAEVNEDQSHHEEDLP